MTKQLFGLFFGWVWRPSLCDGLMDQDTIGLPHPSLIILGRQVHEGKKSTIFLYLFVSVVLRRINLLLWTTSLDSFSLLDADERGERG
jgi:hypothetical protein